MSGVRINRATRQFAGMSHPAVDGVDITVGDGEFLVLVGPSGCGKSTLLRMVAGLEKVDAGNISIGDRDVTDLAPKDRNIAMVFQSYALYPHMTVAENIGFNLKINNVDKEEIKRRVEETARMLDLSDLLERKPAKLSGAIVRKPEVFLMDEPLSNLDAKLRVQTRTQIAELQRNLGVTTLYVTHDQVEAMTMGQRIAVLKDGVLQQIAAPQELFSHPANLFVAGFIGSPAMNLIPTQASNGSVSFAGASVHVSGSPASSVVVGVRPEGLELTGADGTAGVVEFVSKLSAQSRVSLRAKSGALHVFDAQSGLRISA
ncbi:MAG: ATP-binding cassette domain-containing protein [Actinobacteria bacterium]|nr:ATP-binding cassette domain-containing protein [Actinomycetota bacterium]